MIRLLGEWSVLFCIWIVVGVGGPVLGAEWSSSDVGTVGIVGSATYNASTDTHFVSGSGGGTGGTADAFHFKARLLSGDGEIVARIVTQSNTGAGARAGLMIREATTPGSRHAFLHTTMSNGIQFQSRTVADGASTASGATGSVPVWLKLIREGTLVSGYRSADGVAWTLVHALNLPLAYDVSVGLAVTSGDDLAACVATFDHVEVTDLLRPAGLSGFYFHGGDLSAFRALRRDGAINFDWAGASPDEAVESGDYSVRWKGEVLPAFSETYTFYALADDKIRLWVNDQLIINQWTSHSLAEDTGTIALSQGIYYRLRLEYGRITGSGTVVLSWSSPSLAKEVIPYLRLRNLDFDDDGLPDTWEIAYGLDPGNPADAAGDLDGDGVSNFQEYQNTSDPIDYYNGNLPALAITGGDNQSAAVDTILALPLTVRVTSGGVPRSNAPVIFQVSSGGGNLANSGGGALSSPITVRTDSQGYATIYFHTPASPGESAVSAEAVIGANSARVQFFERSTGPGQDPLSQSGLRLWFRANDGATKDVDDTVSLWNDRSGNGSNASQVTSSARPLWVANAINGQPVLRFNGTSHFLSLPNAMAGAAAGDMFVVLKAAQDTPSAPNGFLRMGTHSYGSNYPWTDGVIYEDFGSTSAHTVGNPSQPLDQYHLYNATSSSGQWMARINGTTLLTESSNTVAFHTNPLLGKRNAGDCWAGDFAEILVYDRVLSSAERRAVQSYLNQKYQVVAVPAAPTALQALAVSASQIDLTWSSVPDAVEYLIERKAEDESTFSSVATVAGSRNAFVDGGLTAGKSYTYRVRASSLGLNSTASPEASLATLSAGPALATAGLRVWLRADSGLLVDGSGYVSRWTDHSGLNNDAVQTTGSARPQHIAAAIHSRPVLRFNGTSHYLALPNAMAGATAGDMFVVLKAAQDTPAAANGFMRMGTNSYGSNYPWTDGIIYDDFGCTTYHTVGNPAQPLDQYHLYNATSESGKWVARLNGAVALTDTANTVAFPTAPLLGKRNAGDGWAGDFAEILIFDHVLTNTERDAVNGYFNRKYSLVAPVTAPEDLRARAVSSTQTDLSWSPVIGATSYLIQRKAGGETTFTTVGTVAGTVTAFLDGGLTAGQGYTYRIIASSLGTVSESSAEIAITTDSSTAPFSTTGLLMWLRADSGVVANGIGAVSRWEEFLAGNNNATQATGAARPHVVPDVLNGCPVMRFSGSAGQFFDLPNVMSGATAGEAIVVLRSTASPGVSNGLWQFGNFYNVGAAHPTVDGAIYDDFGSVTGYQEAQPRGHDVTEFHIYGVSSQANLWQNSIDGRVVARTTTNTVSFITNPLLGKTRGYQSPSFFTGDIAEVLVFDRVLSVSERASVSATLARKYALGGIGVPTDVTASRWSATQSVVTWKAEDHAIGEVTYTIERRTDPAGAFAVVGQVTGRHTFVDTTVNGTDPYEYRVSASDWVESTAFSSAVALTGPAPADPFPVSGLRLWLNASTGASSSLWEDQSGHQNHGTQWVSGNQPTVVDAVVQGQSVVRFDGAAQQFFELPHVLSGATAGEAIVVLKSAVTPVGAKGLWQFGNHYNVGAAHPAADGQVYDDFGSSTGYFETPPVGHNLTTFHLYAVSSQSGLWQNWIDGRPLASSTTNTVSFIPNPLLGKTRGYQAPSFYSGDIAEVLIFERALTALERKTVERFLARKYLLGAFDLDGDGLTNAEEATVGSDPLNPDTNGDGLWDGPSVTLGIDPASMDSDQDGLTNAQELALGTNPLEADSDHDGVADSLDYYPLDPTRSAAAPSLPGAPVITLTSPSGLTLQP